MHVSRIPAHSAGDALRRRHEALPDVVQTRTRRLYFAAIPVVQCALAAGLSWYIAEQIFGHFQPFFAPIAAVVSLGLSVGSRWRRSVELIVGVAVGIAVADLLVRFIGSGTWQIMVTIAVAMTVAVIIDNGPMVPIQAASSAVLASILLSSGSSAFTAGLDRMIDALVGAGAAFLAVAFLPTHPVWRARRDAARIVIVLKAVVEETVEGLRTDDEELIADALEEARSTQPAIDAFRADLKGGFEISTISPLYWRARPRLKRLDEIADPLDNAMRNLRVLVRRSLASVQVGEHVDGDVIDAVAGLLPALNVVQDMILADPGQQPDAAATARAVRTAARQAPVRRVSGRGVAETVILSQLRSILVDMLEVAGMSKASAVATLRSER